MNFLCAVPAEFVQTANRERFLRFAPQGQEDRNGRAVRLPSVGCSRFVAAP